MKDSIKDIFVKLFFASQQIVNLETDLEMLTSLSEHEIDYQNKIYDLMDDVEQVTGVKGDIIQSQLRDYEFN